jgi:hypothetical protein
MNEEAARASGQEAIAPAGLTKVQGAEISDSDFRQRQDKGNGQEADPNHEDCKTAVSRPKQKPKLQTSSLVHSRRYSSPASSRIQEMSNSINNNKRKVSFKIQTKRIQNSQNHDPKIQDPSKIEQKRHEAK